MPHSGGWAVKGEGNVKASSVHSTQSAAESAARRSAIRTGSEVFIHGRDGRIRERNTYGRDPFPPKG
ncbi:DUF2188 domain-containing protein [Erythrobacter sp. BLCC-B19]|uniref:DUF2188 domain-containing protein n=1 Tax=Erythrobacter sp. BLCC-B19 TaxID=3025315 RepID=UPI00235EE1D6|nr:DUF2188 domain-containing protein [Erythrobacter sp. BLCC-B19]WDA42869.1 DUF2188 domain-containing protein [Erythrobacter sp. BLCC-B19]